MNIMQFWGGKYTLFKFYAYQSLNNNCTLFTHFYTQTNITSSDKKNNTFQYVIWV